MLRLLAAVGCGLVLSSVAGAQTPRLIALDSNHSVYELDLTTGARTLLGSFTAGGTSVGGLAYDCATQTLYMTSTTLDSLWRLDLDTMTATEIGPYGDSAVVMHGLEWDNSTGTLYGASSHNSGVYTINTTTGQATLIGSTGLPTGGFLNLGYNSLTDTMYATHTTTDSFYSINRATGQATLIGPMTGTSSPHALAFNHLNGQLYLIDSTTDTLYTIDVASGAVTVIGLPGSGNYLGLAMIAPCATTSGANISVVVSGPADCAVPVGGNADYTITVANFGPEPAADVVLTVTIPANTTLVSSSPPGSLVGDTLTIPIGNMAASANSPVAATLTVNSGTSVVLAAAVTTTSSDPTLLNNQSSDNLVIPASVPTSAAIKGLFSTFASSPTSDVPGQPGIKFATPERPFISPDGTKWVMNVDTTAATGQDDIILSGVFGGSYSIIAQEGVTMLPEGDILQIIPSVMGVNDSGHVAFNADTNNSTTADEVIVKWDGAAFTTVVREGTEASVFGAGFGVLFGGTMDGVSIQNDGTVSFYSSLTGIGAATDTAWFTDSGAAVLTQEGVTVATNQANGGLVAATTLQTGATEGAGLFLNASGSSFSGIHDLLGVATAENRVLVVNNDVKIQEGHIIPGSGFTSPVASASPLTNFMAASGDWYSYGSNADGQDWVVRNGAVVAKTGDPLFPGSDKLWGDSSFAQTFFMVTGNAGGSYVVGGVFNGGDATVKSNAALVLNGTTIIARENDPIDLDGNGVFDDGVYLRTFVDDRIVMTADAVYAVVRLRTEADALCGSIDTDQGYAFVRIPISTGPTACNAADIATAGNPDPNAGPDGFLTGDDFDLFINAFFNELTRTNGSLIADLVDGDGNLPPDGFLTGSDFDYFLAKFFAGC